MRQHGDLSVKRCSCDRAGWNLRGEIFGDDVVAAALIDRLVHHAEILALKVTATDYATATFARPTRDD